MKNIILLFGFLFYLTSLNAQWLTKDDFLKGSKCISEPFKEYIKIPDIDSSLLKKNIEEIERRKVTYYKALKLLHSVSEPPVIEYPIFDYDTITNIEKDSLHIIINKLRQKKHDYYSSIAKPLDNLVKYPTNYYLLQEDKDFLVQMITKYVKGRGYTPFVLKILSFLDLNKNSRDTLLSKTTDYSDIVLLERAKLGDSIAERKFINDFLTIVRDTIVTDNSNYGYFGVEPELIRSAHRLFYIDSERTWNVFFKELSKNRRFYTEFLVDMNNVVSARVKFETFILLKAYNSYYYNDLEYFFKTILSIRSNVCGKPNRDMTFYMAVSKYLSEKHNRKVKITERYAENFAYFIIYDTRDIEDFLEKDDKKHTKKNRSFIKFWNRTE